MSICPQIPISGYVMMKGLDPPTSLFPSSKGCKTGMYYNQASTSVHWHLLKEKEIVRESETERMKRRERERERERERDVSN